ncbi:hypothetical protein [Nocardia sp. MW-W600-9]
MSGAATDGIRSRLDGTISPRPGPAFLGVLTGANTGKMLVRLG